MKKDETKFQKETFCYKCFKQAKNCLCPLIKKFHTKVKFVILMHPMEAKKEKMGTGRICLQSLENSLMIMGIDFTQNSEVNSLINDQTKSCYILYPGPRSLNISADDVSELIHDTLSLNKEIVVFVIDGTWPCAKKMMKLSVNLQSLPLISFSHKKNSIFEIKEQPADFCLSTLESIHFFIQECNRRGLESTYGKEDQMIVVFQEMIRFQLACAQDPELKSYRHHSKGGYSRKEDRVKSKKWVGRESKIFWSIKS